MYQTPVFKDDYIISLVQYAMISRMKVEENNTNSTHAGVGKTQIPAKRTARTESAKAGSGKAVKTCEPAKTELGKTVKTRETVKASKTFYTYMLRCGDGSLYTGYTDDLEKRVATHAAGKGGKYTHSHLPVRLVYYEVLASKSEALKREAAIKKLTKKEKEALAAGFIKETDFL